MKRLFLALALSSLISPAWGQWQTPSGTIPVGRGAGVTGFSTVGGSGGAGLKCLSDTTPPTFTACPGSPTTELGWYVVGTAAYPTAQSAATAANAAGGGIVYFPCKPPINSTFSLGGAAIGLDMRNFRNVRLVGGNSVNSGGGVCTYIHYTGTGKAIDVSGAIGTEMNGILVYAPSADAVVSATNQGNLLSYMRVTQSNFQGKVTAPGKCFDLSYVIIVDVQTSSINCYIGGRGLITGAGPPTETSNVVNWGPGNTFQPGNSIHLQNAHWWNVFNNTFEGGLTGKTYEDTVAGCNTLNMLNNKFDDPQAVAATLIDTRCIQYNSEGNLYSVATGNTVINYQASSGMLTSKGDWFDSDTRAISLNTGNYAVINGETFNGGSFYSGVPASVKTAARIWGGLEITGAASIGTSGALNGTINWFGATSGTVVTRAQAVAGTPTILWPTASGTVVTTATGLLAVNATTGQMTCTNCASAALGLSQFAVNATSSAQLAALLTNETGTGAAVFGTSPVLVTPDLGTPSAVALNNATFPASGTTTTTAACTGGGTVSAGATVSWIFKTYGKLVWAQASATPTHTCGTSVSLPLPTGVSTARGNQTLPGQVASALGNLRGFIANGATTAECTTAAGTVCASATAININGWYEIN
jgi:hypothetical protein